MHSLLLLTLMSLSAGSLSAQSESAGQSGPRSTMDRDLEIALARSAAPSAVSETATVLVFTQDGYRVAVEGTGGVTCYVSRSWVESVEPHCFDHEAATTILPMSLKTTEMRHEGAAPEEIDAVIAEGLRNGEFRLPTRPAMSYMMSSAQVLYNDEGEYVGAWKPHLMIYYPYLTGEELGLMGPPSIEAAIVVDPGTPRANIMIVVNDFVDPVQESKTTR